MHWYVNFKVINMFTNYQDICILQLVTVMNMVQREELVELMDNVIVREDSMAWNAMNVLLVTMDLRKTASVWMNTLFVFTLVTYLHHFVFSACNCRNGAVHDSCDEFGQCQCKRNFQGDKCDECKPGFFNYPTCKSMKEFLRFTQHIIFLVINI